MTTRHDSMRPAQALLSSLAGMNVPPPKVLQNLVDGFALLDTDVTPADPADAIIDAAVDGKLTPKSRDELFATAAAADAMSKYRQGFGPKAERKFAQRFHTALLEGAADQVLDGLRPLFDAVAEELTAARNSIDLQSTPARLLNVTATAEEQTAWGQLPDLLRQIDRIASIAAAFGPQADLAVIEDLTQYDSMLNLGWIQDRALMCTDGNLVTASKTFLQPNALWQQSPWLRVTPKLATITEARDRFREAAEGDWAARESHRHGRGALTESGFVPETRNNPHTLRESVTA